MWYNKFMSKFDLHDLNKQQYDALIETEGAVLVTAGAGSGKTKLLTYRIAHLIENLGVSPYEILAITFTNKAAREMKERAAALCAAGGDVWISTFHSMCVIILRENIHYLDGFSGNFSIYSDSDTEKLIKKICDENKFDDSIKKDAIYYIDKIKNQDMDIDDFALENKYLDCVDEIVKIYHQYQKSLKESNALDFDDLLLKTLELFATFPEVKQKYANRFRYVLVDEFQDTNAVQMKLVKHLTSVHKNVFVVGDEDQCIYTWRGANFENIYGFENYFSGCKTFKLERNYRSTKQILDSANKIILNNKERHPKSLYTENNEGDSVQSFVGYDEGEEAEFVANKIQELVAKFGYSYSDFAVLMRLNALTLPFEQSFLAHNIPHKIFGGFKFYERQEIKNILSYLKLFLNPSDEMSFLRVINFPKRGIGEGALDKLRVYASANNQTLLQACESISKQETQGPLQKKFAGFWEEYEKIKNTATTSVVQFVKLVIDSFNIRSAYNPDIEQENDKLINIDQFVTAVEGAVGKQPDLTLGEFVENVTLESDADGMENSDNHVKLATIHAVKGLEFKVVFVVGLEEKIFPIIRNNISTNSEMEEERRLMYVAITRAEERLYLTRTKCRYLYGKRDFSNPSRFLTELGLEKKVAPLNLSEHRQKFSSFNVSNFNNFRQKENNSFETPKKDLSIYRVGQNVTHTRFGDGKIISIDLVDRCADINFEDYGTKTLMLDIAPLTIL